MSTITLPRTGTWTIDASHSSLEFAAKHLVVSKVHGRFSSFSGSVAIVEPIENSEVDVTIASASITTNDDDRDGHVKSGDFLDVEAFPTLTFRSTGVHNKSGDDWSIPGELTIRDVTEAVDLEVEYLGVFNDPWGNPEAAFAATTTIDREQFGITWNAASRPVACSWARP
jgi:polyisoprenoid-binding protein YceI